MTRTILTLVLISFLFCVYSSPEDDVHYTLKSVDEVQIPVPPEAISPFEPKDVTYVDEPLLELDSDWNLDVKLLSKYRYTNKFVERWREKHGYTPTRPVMSEEEFFNNVNLNHPGLEAVKAAIADGDFIIARDKYLSYQEKRARPIHLKFVNISKEEGEAAVKKADNIIAEQKLHTSRTEIRSYLFSFMGSLERAYLHTKDIKYANAWLEMFNHFYVTNRPPAQRPMMYICFRWEPYWSPLGSSGRAKSLCKSERWLIQARKLGLDENLIFIVYKSILEYAQYLYSCNDVFMPGNWQTNQCETLIKIGAYFPSFKQAQFLREHSWKLMQEHMVQEIYDDGTHIENAINYAIAVNRHNMGAVRIIRKLGLEIPDEFSSKWKSMYLSAIKIIPPTGSSIAMGDGSFGAEGSLVKPFLIQGALEFGDPAMKYFAEKYPDDVEKIAEDQFENTSEVLAAYNKVKAEKPSFTSTLLPDADWAIMRTSWDKNSPYMFFDGGRDEAWHSHPDFGSFNIWAYGEPLITECGNVGTYSADISKRWRKQTIGHNTVMVDSRSMRKCVNNRITQWWTGANYDYVDAKSDGYRWIGVLHNRRVLFVKPGYWIVTDFLPGPSYYNASFQTSGYHEFDWLTHFQPTELTIDKDTKRIDTMNESANIALVPLNADEVQLKESKGPTETTTGVVETPYISLHREGMAFVQFQVLLLAYEGTKAPDIKINRLTADNIDRVHRQNVGYEIAALGRKDIFLESSNPKVLTSFGDYKFRGAVAHIRDAEEKNAHYLLVNADYFASKGKLIFSAPQTIKAIELSATESTELKIITESDVSGIKIYAPDVIKVLVNDKEHKFSRDGEYVILGSTSLSSDLNGDEVKFNKNSKHNFG